MRDLGQGMTGTDVRTVQQALNFQIRRLPPIAMDGNYGPATKARVIEFQKANSPLRVDGIVGPKTRGFLFELTDVAIQILYVPQLTLPTFGELGGFSRRGIQPPRLIPPLTLPNLTLDPPVVPGQSMLMVNPFASGGLVAFRQPAVVNTFITVPTRNDPVDPFQRSRQQLVGIVNSIPVDAKFRASIISMIPTPSDPDPTKRKVSFPGTGFKWDVDFLGIISPFNPNTIKIAGSASFFANIIGRPQGTDFLMQFGAWGDAKAQFDYFSALGQTGFTFSLQYNAFLGARGVF